MNLDKMFVWITAVVIALAAAGRLDVLQNWIWRAQAKVIPESRTSTWRSPRFLFSAPKVQLFTSQRPSKAETPR